MTRRVACYVCHERPITIGFASPHFDRLIFMCNECYEKETTK